MKAAWTIFKREVHSFFVSPMAYVLLTCWLLFCGVVFWILAEYYAGQPMGGGAQDSPLTAFFGGTTLFYLPMLVFVPLVTMRLIAEERNRGTLEVLMTAPVSEVSVIVGKYFAALLFWVAMWVPTLLYVWLTSRYGDVDMGAIGTGYLGIFGIGVYYLAIGVLMSAVSPNQIVSAILTFVALAGLFVVGLGQYVFGDEYRELFAYLSIWGHMEAFSRGVVDTRYLTFDVSVAVVTLSLATGALQARRVEG
ncbi:MAG: ABC transporter permease [Sandaracinaceae bacterium]|nr:ABC transporter permease [Sandaracinaceae bacterium]